MLDSDQTKTVSTNFVGPAFLCDSQTVFSETLNSYLIYQCLIIQKKLARHVTSSVNFI